VIAVARKLLFDACELATQVRQAPMRLYAQQRHVPSLKLEMSGPPAAVS
jgi:hypothetical protein